MRATRGDVRSRVPGNRRNAPFDLLPAVEYAANGVIDVNGDCDLETDFAPLMTPLIPADGFEPAAILATQSLQQDTAAALAGRATLVADPCCGGELIRDAQELRDESNSKGGHRVDRSPSNGLSGKAVDRADPPPAASAAAEQPRPATPQNVSIDAAEAPLRHGADVKFPRLKISPEMKPCRAAILADIGLPDATQQGRIVLLASVDGTADSTLAAAEIAKSLVGTAAGHVLVIDGGTDPRDELTRQPTQPGFASLLLGSRQLSELVAPTQIDGLRMVPRGLGEDLWPQIDDALALQRLGEIREQYAFTVVDAGPWDRPIVAAAGPHVEAVYLVVQAGRSEVAAAKRAARYLGRLGTPLKGCLLVGC